MTDNKPVTTYWWAAFKNGNLVEDSVSGHGAWPAVWKTKKEAKLQHPRCEYRKVKIVEIKNAKRK